MGWIVAWGAACGLLETGFMFVTITAFKRHHLLTGHRGLFLAAAWPEIGIFSPATPLFDLLPIRLAGIGSGVCVVLCAYSFAFIALAWLRTLRRQRR
jgi:hypothetical protein